MNTDMIETGAKLTAEVACALAGRKPGRADLAAAASDLRKLMGKPSRRHYISFAAVNGRPLWLWVAEDGGKSITGRAAIVRPCFIDTTRLKPAALRELVAWTKEYYGGNIKLRVAVPTSQKGKIPFFLKNGFKVNSHVLYGKVDPSLRALERRLPELPAGYAIRLADLKKEFKTLSMLEYITARSDSSCFVSKVSIAALRRDFFEKLRDKRPKGIFGLYFRGSMVGTIRVWETKKGKEGLIGNIGVLPAHRGKGLSAHLYKEGLRWMKARKLGAYLGRTSTERVLSQLSSMKRKIICTYLAA